MTNKSALLELASLCERAVYPAPDDADAEELVAIKSGICHLILGRPYDAYSPDYTGSLDAAMSLVPEGWFWRVGHSTLYEGWAATNRLHPDHCNREDETFAKAATPAIALCAAALRALAKEKGE